MNAATKTGAMRYEYPIESLREEWIKFLQRRGHRVQRAEGVSRAIVSQSKKNNGFRWLLFTAQGRIKRLTPTQCRNLGREIQRAKEAGQRPYVVVHFTVPVTKVVIKPAGRVLETGRIGSAHGGIAWW